MIHKPERKTKSGNKETRIGTTSFNMRELDPDEAAEAIMAETQRNNDLCHFCLGNGLKYA